MTVGMAILSDIETFFFIRAAQGDTRTNIMFAPKVTLFNGQVATVQDDGQPPVRGERYADRRRLRRRLYAKYRRKLTKASPMTVAAVVSADRRFVRLSVFPIFRTITDIFTFTFVKCAGQSELDGIGPGSQRFIGSTGSSGFGGGLSGSGVSGSGAAGISGTPTSGACGTTSTSSTNLSAGNITVQQPVVESIIVSNHRQRSRWRDRALGRREAAP